MWGKRDRSSPATGRRWNQLGKAGRAPGRGFRNTAGTNPGSLGRDRPMRGRGFTVNRKPPNRHGRWGK